ncbi:hypothetical protein AUQ48_10615 [Kocuria flava]|uniref:Uncharacterized protein n=1 Tax=Kocuria flava TaxID=446860 RepID=A0A2N4T2Y0_9MICC|nr:hypothetical protein AUQ48_10615 [Kocuria flava]
MAAAAGGPVVVPWCGAGAGPMSVPPPSTSSRMQSQPRARRVSSSTRAGSQSSPSRLAMKSRVSASASSDVS